MRTLPSRVLRLADPSLGSTLFRGLRLSMLLGASMPERATRPGNADVAKGMQMPRLG